MVFLKYIDRPFYWCQKLTKSDGYHGHMPSQKLSHFRARTLYNSIFLSQDICSSTLAKVSPRWSGMVRMPQNIAREAVPA